MINVLNLVDDAKCYQTVRALRWPDGPTCPHCHSQRIASKGRDGTQAERRRYQCHICGRKFDDLTGTTFAGHHQPLRVWILCLSLMGLNLSNAQIGAELGLNKDDAQTMTTQLRQGIVQAVPDAKLKGVIEADEVYVVAGHKGHPSEVKKGGVLDDEDV